MFERGVLGGDALDGFLGPFGFQVADAAVQLAETGRSAAALDVPLLSAGLVALAAMHGVVSWRRDRQRVAG